ncbi:hypothetical protein PGT21_005468 [Puccinia graminis f. sp. tritici]|uniref:Secreted protein n=1 Tax=Puccinia graminis f. sp. tritici TaxID=56615 RepID=A0A5B0PJE6_PUCGR|nr:hypothetical protein PGT21_005468 [Puccinia graminis f. sp. tritici]
MFDRRFVILFMTSLLLAGATIPKRHEYRCGTCNNPLTIKWCDLGGKQPCPVPLSAQCAKITDGNGKVLYKYCGGRAERLDLVYVLHYHEGKEPYYQQEAPHTGRTPQTCQGTASIS